ncbi:MAG: zinc ribbon domain-containing protein [Candidatus Woesearchaeota archaeon]|jgi:predicted nucleic acid-binding Zn ribbon protein|nr:zinc ribbon domain-containing protein [Candidatus Woesearchaeota archaeon]
MIPEFNHCKSCGAPIDSRDLCKNCSNNDGSLKSYNEVLENMINFMLSTEGIQMSGEKFDSYEDAKGTAKKYLKHMSAWENI